jgi:hypothetical protein
MSSVSVIASLATLSVALPTIAWTGGGWYQTEATASDYRIVSGPFASKDLCIAQMRPDTADTDYRCYDMPVRPRWEK